jgi:DNA-binding protein
LAFSLHFDLDTAFLNLIIKVETKNYKLDEIQGYGRVACLSRTDKDPIIIGLKPLMNYIVACMTLFNSGAPSATVKARGRHISKAVDVVEMLRRVFFKDLKVDNIELGTQTHGKPGGRSNSV